MDNFVLEHSGNEINEAISKTEKLNFENGVAVGTGASANSQDAIAIGTDAFVPLNAGDSIAIGRGATVNDSTSIVIGDGDIAGSSGRANVAIAGFAMEDEAVAIKGKANGYQSVAIGAGAYAEAHGSIQIGTATGHSTNTEENTVQIKDTQILNSQGKIPTNSIDGTNGNGTKFLSNDGAWKTGGTSDYTQLENIPRTPFTPTSDIVNINEFAREPQGYDVMQAFTLVNDTYDEATGEGAKIDIPKGALIVTDAKYNSRLKKWVLNALTINSNRGDFVLLEDTINSDNWDREYTPIMSEVLAELDNRIGAVETNLTSVIDDLEGVL